MGQSKNKLLDREFVNYITGGHRGTTDERLLQSILEKMTEVMEVTNKRIDDLEKELIRHGLNLACICKKCGDEVLCTHGEYEPHIQSRCQHCV